jgi:predicted O-methyltransferase YrrM
MKPMGAGWTAAEDSELVEAVLNAVTQGGIVYSYDMDWGSLMADKDAEEVRAAVFAVSISTETVSISFLFLRAAR